MNRAVLKSGIIMCIDNFCNSVDASLDPLAALSADAEEEELEVMSRVI